jgi:hypothetical protein
VAGSPPRFGLVGDGAVRRPGGCVAGFVEEQGRVELDDSSRNRVEKELGGGGHGERRAAELTGCAGSAWAANGRRGEGEWRLREKPACAQCHLDRRMHGWARGVSTAPRRMALALYRSVCALHGLGASAYDLRSFPRRVWSIAKTPRRPYAGVKRGSHVAGAVQTRWARRRRRPSQVLFRLSLFEIAKLQKSSTNSKISTNKSCRGAIDLQLYKGWHMF